VSDSAKSSQLSLTDPFTRSLACAAISPGLRNILVFDASPETLRLAAQTTAQMLEVIMGHPVVSVTLGTFEAEDDLWGSLGLCGESEEQPFQWKQGLLAAGQNDSQLRLVLIPDLTKLSLAAARACVVLMGADVAHLERHGQQANWKPNLCWLAGCDSGEVGVVSPHLLDRFALRLSGRVTKTTDRAAEILGWMDDRALEKETKPELLPSEIRDRLKKALLLRPAITAEVTARILDYTATLDVYSPRREIALARLALANAQLEGAAKMSGRHVTIAVRMIGLKLVTQHTEELSELNSEPVTLQPDLLKSNEDKQTSTPSLSDEPDILAFRLRRSDSLSGLGALALVNRWGPTRLSQSKSRKDAS
jgi:magnesium chelatase subunit D